MAVPQKAPKIISSVLLTTRCWYPEPEPIMWSLRRTCPGKSVPYRRKITLLGPRSRLFFAVGCCAASRPPLPPCSCSSIPQTVAIVEAADRSQTEETKSTFCIGPKSTRGVRHSSASTSSPVRVFSEFLFEWPTWCYEQ